MGPNSKQPKPLIPGGAPSPDAEPVRESLGGDEQTHMALGGEAHGDDDPGDGVSLELSARGAIARRVDGKVETAMRKRAEALDHMLSRVKDGPLERYEGGYKDVTWKAPAWAFKVLDEVQAHPSVNIEKGAQLAEHHIRVAVRFCAERIWTKCSVSPEDSVRLMSVNESDLKTEADCLEWYGAHPDFRERVEDLLDRRWSEEATLREARTRFLEDVGKALCASLREGAGVVNPNIPLDFLGMPQHSTELGGYPLFYLTADGGVLSPEAVIENIDLTNDPNDKQWYVVAVDVNYEDPDLICDHTGKRIPSAYAEPEDGAVEGGSDE